MKPVRQLLDGQLGTARVGLWAETVQDDMRATLLPIVGLIVGCLVLSIALVDHAREQDDPADFGFESDRRRHQPRPARYLGIDSNQRRGRRIGPLARTHESEPESSDDSLEPRIGVHNRVLI